uniref:Methionine-r-sulfoxide reductase b1 n=2 Tax=Ictalurus furcatus TaxID=66913 RepID=E3TBS4_ICTFU|nr:methionine-r-sulfoxide reductase b1 [Ictalurus furcatus]
MAFCSFKGGEIFKDHYEPGIYVCVKCGYELFSSTSKYKHSSPWPAFTTTIHEDSVSKQEERPGALKIRCGKCNNGLGHEFLNDGPKHGLSRF